MKHLLCIIFALVVTIHDSDVTISDGNKEIVTICMPGGTLVIRPYTLIIDDKSMRIVPTEVTDVRN